MTDAQIEAALRRMLAPVPVPTKPEWLTDRAVILALGMGLIAILLAIIVGLLLTPRALPNWAENVFVSIATAAALKLGDALSALVNIASGKSVERLGNHLANAPPPGPTETTIVNGPSDPVPTHDAGATPSRTGD